MSRNVTSAVCALVVLLVLVGPAGAAVVGLVCNGTACGGDGPRDYWYELAIDEALSGVVLNVGTGDHNEANYSNFYAAMWVAGSWVPFSPNPAFGYGGPMSAHTPMTAHGNGPVSPNTTTNMVVGFFPTAGQFLQPGTYGFGYDNDTDPMDVGWWVDANGQVPFECDWSEPVGLGLGPVHGPLPEPAAIALLAAGAAALLRRRR